MYTTSQLFNIAEANKTMEMEKFDKGDIKKVPKDAVADDENGSNDSDTAGNDNNEPGNDKDGHGNDDYGPGNDDDGPGNDKDAANTDNEDEADIDNNNNGTDRPSDPYLIGFFRGVVKNEILTKIPLKTKYGLVNDPRTRQKYFVSFLTSLKLQCRNLKIPILSL